MSDMRRSAVAAAVAAAILFACGIGYRVLAARLARPVESSPLPPGTLAKFPLELADWSGREVPMDQAVIRATDTDDLLNRNYTRRSGGDSVGFYVAYGVRARDLMPHRPEVCYPGAGWTLNSSEPAQVTLKDGSRLACQLYRFTKGAGLTDQRIVVLNYYIIDGAYCADVSALRSSAWRGQDAVNYTAQVQVTCAEPAYGGFSAGAESVRAFAAAAAVELSQLLREAHAALPGTASVSNAEGGRP